MIGLTWVARRRRERVMGLVISLAVTSTTNHWGAQEWWALGAVVVLIALAYLLKKWTSAKDTAYSDRGGLLMGWDRRLSTSKTIAVAWTFAVAYMVLVVLFVAMQQPHSAQFFSTTLGKASELYLVFLGGPYAAAVIAKVNTNNNAQVQKSDGSGAINPFDVIGNDAGAVDLYDFQYTLFNLIAIFSVLIVFLGHPGLGLPAVPTFLATLTGGSALVYTTNKVVRTNPPQLTNLSPAVARVGDPVTLYGSNFLPTGATDGQLFVTIGDKQTVTVTATDPDQATFTVPAAPDGAKWPADSQSVKIATPDVKDSGAGKTLLVIPDTPVLDSLGTLRAGQGSKVTLTGHYFLPPRGAADTTPSVLAQHDDGTVTELPLDAEAKVSDTHLTAELPADIVPAGQNSIDVKVTVARSGAAAVSDQLPLTVTA